MTPKKTQSWGEYKILNMGHQINMSIITSTLEVCLRRCCWRHTCRRVEQSGAAWKRPVTIALPALCTGFVHTTAFPQGSGNVTQPWGWKSPGQIYQDFHPCFRSYMHACMCVRRALLSRNINHRLRRALLLVFSEALCFRAICSESTRERESVITRCRHLESNPLH